MNDQLAPGCSPEPLMAPYDSTASYGDAFTPLPPSCPPAPSRNQKAPPESQTAPHDSTASYGDATTPSCPPAPPRSQKAPPESQTPLRGAPAPSPPPALLPASSAAVLQLPRSRGSAGTDRGAASESRIGVTTSTWINVNMTKDVTIDSVIKRSSSYTK